MMQEICEKANLLRLKIIGEQLPQIMDMAGKKNWPCLKTMAHLFDLEIETRRQKPYRRVLPSIQTQRKADHRSV